LMSSFMTASCTILHFTTYPNLTNQWANSN